MDWFFGSSKKSTKPEVYVSNVVEGDFNVVSSTEPAGQPYPLYPSLPPRPLPPAQYPSSLVGYPPQLPHFSQHHQYQRQTFVQPQTSAVLAEKPLNPLDSIPFKLSSGLDPKSMPVSEYQLKLIKSQIDNASDRINSDSYNYSFELERSVLRELNYR